MLVQTTAMQKMVQLQKRIKGVQGGTSAGKTYGIIPLEIDYAQKFAFTETSIVAESIPHLKRGALKDFKKIMYETNRWYADCWNATDKKYTFFNGSYIEFFSVDDDSKLRGARRDRLYMNEANNMKFDAYTQLVSRTKGSVIMDWNPTAEFWFHTELMSEPNVDYIVLTYKDNEACPASAIEFINMAKKKAETSDFWANWYRVYGEGEIGSLEGVVFTNWTVVDKIPEEAYLVGYGMDFGFSNDPSTMLACYKLDQEIYWDECIYQTGLLNSDIARMAMQYDEAVIYADDAEPKSIQEIKRRGLLIRRARKGTINSGIAVLQEYDMRITARSTNTIHELQNYRWFVDKDGVRTNKPIDNFNHSIDAMRYLAINKLSKQSGIVRAYV